MSNCRKRLQIPIPQEEWITSVFLPYRLPIIFNGLPGLAGIITAGD